MTLEADVFKNLVNYKGVSHLKKAALNLLVRQAMIEADADPTSDPSKVSAETLNLRQRINLLKE